MTPAEHKERIDAVVKASGVVLAQWQFDLLDRVLDAHERDERLAIMWPRLNGRATFTKLAAEVCA